MKKLIILFLFILGLQTYGQKLIEETYQNKGNTKFVTESKAFYHNQTFLNDDSTYTKKRFFAKTGKQIYENNYCSINPDVRCGRQISYSENDTLYFDNDIPTGIWNVNDFFKGKRVILNYNFKLMYAPKGQWPNFPYNQINNHLNDLNKKPQFKNGFQDFNKYIYDNRYFDVFNLGKAALQTERPAIVRLSFEVDSTGKVNNVLLIKGVHPIYDKEAVRLIRESPDWSPGSKNGKLVNSTIYYWIHFQRDKEYE